jgi:cell division protein FtsL
MSAVHAQLPRVQQPAPRPRLAIVPAYRHRPSRTPFVLLLVVLLSVGLITLLLLNTALSQDSFRLSDLRRHSAQLTDDEQGLERQIADLEAPQRLAKTARELGLRPSGNPIFLRTPDGRVIGDTGQ